MKRLGLLLIVLASAVLQVVAQDRNYVTTGNKDGNANRFYPTDYAPNINTKIKVHFKYHAVTGNKKQDIFGIWHDSDGAQTILLNTNNDHLTAYFGSLTGVEASKVKLEDGSNYVITLDKDQFIVDKDYEKTTHDQTLSMGATNLQTSIPFVIGSCRYKDNDRYSSLPTYIDVYSCQIYENNVLVRNYIPTTSDSINYKFYDTVNKKTISGANGKDSSTGHCVQCTDHKYMQIMTDANDNLYGYCPECDKQIVISDWTQKEDLGLQTIDPTLNVSADMCEIGNVTSYFSSSSQINKFWLLNEDTNEVLAYADCSSSPTYGQQLNMPQSENTVKLALVADMIVTKSQDGLSCKDIETAVKHFSYKPFHSMKGFKLYETINPDSVGIMHPNNEISWYIENPDTADVISADQFTIKRSKYPNFREYESFSSLSFSDVKNKTTLSDGTKVGYFNFVDDTDEAQYNEYGYGALIQVLDTAIEHKIDNDVSLSNLDKTALKGFYTHPSRKVYYRVERAIVESMWPDHRGKFCIDDSVCTNVTLPAVTKVSVQQGDNWSNDKKVTVTIQLKNPYPWEYNQITDSASIRKFAESNGLDYRRYRWDENAQIKVERYSPDEDHERDGSDAVSKTYIISSKDVQWIDSLGCYVAEVSDCQSFPYTHYYYTAWVDGTDSYYPESNIAENVASSKEEAELSYSQSIALISDMEASRGLLGKVNVHWALGGDNMDQLTLERRVFTKGGTNEWTAVKIAKADTEYEDKQANPGEVTEYRLTASYVYRDHTYKSEKIVMGYPSYRGRLAGHVVMPNGVGIAGAKVIVTRKDDKVITIPDIYDNEGNLVMKGVSEGIEADARLRADATTDPTTEDIKEDSHEYRTEVVTDETGAWAVDGILFDTTKGVSTGYNVSVDYGNCKFLYEGEVKAAFVEFSNLQPENTTVKFTCNTYNRISGNVYYEKSTVPVRGAHFVLEFDGKSTVFKNSDDKVIETDNNGFFNILVPNNKVKVMVQKDGHKFKYDGFLVGSAADGEQLEEGNSLDDRLIYDLTKTHLVGRLCGGNIEARKELGYSLSKNNLGDNATIVLQLEGDNSSQIVYDADNPEITQIDTTVMHPATVGSTKYEPRTKTSYQRKRIVINPDSVTGEFFVDIFPTKYKVVQLSAKGYSTLYASGQGFDVIDFTDSINAKTITINGTAKTADISATYVHAYHKPATVTYEQYKYGKKQGFLGDETITEMNLEGVDKTVTVASYDSEEKGAKYLFGYPVFSSDTKYSLQVRAHEDYYYNNEESNTIDEVHLDGGTLHVQNGLLSNQSEETYKLDSLGMTNIVFTAGNTTFSQTETDALRYLNASVELNDYYYEAKPLAGFVTGYRDKNTDILSFDDDISVVDVLRDPYGATSYSWMESGVSYSWTRNYSLSVGASLTINPKLGASASTIVGAWLGMGGGAWTGTQISTAATYGLSVTVPIVNYQNTLSANYSMTTNTKITTSSDPTDVGAMADVYVGTIHTSKVTTAETFSVIDSVTYNAVKGAIDRGTVRVVSSGKDENGAPYYLVVAEKIHMTKDANLRNFAYSQKYIIGTLIPSLIDKRNNMLLYTEDAATVENLANTTKEVKYWSKVPADNIHFGEDGYYTQYNGSDKKANDDVKTLNLMIKKWQYAIALNEYEKYQFMNTTGAATKDIDGTSVSSTEVQNYSIAGASVDYSESYSCYFRPKETWNVAGYNLTNGNYSWDVSGSRNEKTISAGDKSYEDKVNDALDKAKSAPDNEMESDVTAPGFKLSLSLTPKVDFSISNTKSAPTVNNASRGYTISTNDNSYFDIDVVKVRNTTAESAYLNWDDDKMDNTASSSDNLKKAQFSDFLFYLRGGAVRNPYFGADSTLYCLDNGKKLALGDNPLKIDNPKIYIDKTVVSNTPEDEKATFTVHLTNETEIGTNTTGLKASHFTLYVDDATNSNGAKFTMDGEPLTSGRDFIIAPGESITKTLEVERGNGYDFKDMQIVFADTYFKLTDKVNVTVNYLPVATNVNITSPTDKWIMNTYSSTDDNGKYYIPINIEGFNVNSDGFHHIELQYKKQTEGDSQWVTVCGFYKDSLLYAQATGTKEMIPASGKISNVKFYGDNDPMEMKYDLRAVAFRKLGTGFTTRASSVMSGMKDTRCPEVFGLPKPTDGVLGYDDVISIPFSEQIAYNYLNKTSNFQVVGYLNESTASYNTSLCFKTGNADASGSAGVKALGTFPTSKIYRNLTDNDFTIDLMIKLDNEKQSSVLAVVADSDAFRGKQQNDSYLVYSYNNRRFLAVINGVEFLSDEIGTTSLTGNLTHVAMTFTQQPESGKPQVGFYVAGKELDVVGVASSVDESELPKTTKITGKLNGLVLLGCIYNGSMADARLWNKALTLSEFMNKEKKIFSKNEPSLYAYWPMNEGTGHILYDKVNGCDLHFTSPTWQMPEGQHSLRIEGKALTMDDNATGQFDKQDFQDFSLSYWFRIDEKTNLTTADTLTMFKVGSKTDTRYFRIGVSSNTISLTSGKNTYDVAKNITLTDGWHNVVCLVNQSQNATNFYVDGQLTGSMAGTAVAGLGNKNVQFGDEGYYGNFDNLTFWNLALPSSYISYIYKLSPVGKEMGLVYYLPFEKEVLKDGTYTPVFSTSNMKYNEETNSLGEATGKWSADGTEMFTFTADEQTSADDATTYCNTNSVSGLTNIPFSWTATDNELQINIKKADRDINHQTLNITVRNVEDLQGNVLVNPQMMMVYVNRNVLTWEESKIERNLSYGCNGYIYPMFQNLSGRTVSYTLEENCSWLTIENPRGTAGPLEEGYIKMSVSSELAPGDYETTVYLVDENGLSASLPISVTVTPDEPQWEVTADADYCYTMNVMGQVKLTNDGGNEYYDADSRDIVGAFYKNVCIGKAYITKNEAGTPYVYLTIKGNEAMLPIYNGAFYNYQDVAFRLWRASTNQTYIIVPQNALKRIVFQDNSVCGCPPNDPVIFKPTSEIMQTIEFAQGWNWISFNINPKNDIGVNYLFKDESPFTVGDRLVYVNKAGKRVTSEYIKPADGYAQWSNGVDGINNLDHHVYQLYAQNAGTALVLGNKIKDEDRFVKVVPDEKDPKAGRWNELAYLLEVDQPINTALSDYSKDKSVVGTVIKSLTQFAVADENGKWVGSLEAMHPGQGYYTKCFSSTKDTIKIQYTNTEVDRSAKRRTAAKSTSEEEDTESLDLTLTESVNHESNMPVIADINDSIEYQEGDEIIAYANGEMVGSAQQTTLDNGDKRFFISVNSEQGSTVHFALVRDGEVLAKSSNAITYDADLVCGTLDVPFAIDFSQSASNTDEVYDLKGVKYSNADNLKSRKGVYIINGVKQLKK